MNDDELKKLWQQQSLRAPDLSPAQLISATQKQTTLLRLCLKTRDVLELSACVFVGVVFGIYFFIFRAPIQRLGSLITIASAIFVAWKILRARWATPVAKPDATVVESLRAELHSVRTQAKLLRSVAWWYLLPLAVGGLVFVWGGPFDNLAFGLIFKIGFTLFSLALDVYIYWLNQQAVTTQLLPLEAQLESLIHSAETGEPLDEKHVTNRRTIALSMVAAGQVKPVEFKVRATSSAAFWQIAFFGEIGFIGMWFFMMLDLTTSNDDWKTKQQPVATVVQAVFTGETNRYSVVARKIVDLLNAGDHVAVQKLFNPDMSQTLPPQKASEFFTDLAARYGNIEKFDGATTNGYRGWIAFRLYCQHGGLTMSLALDADAKISGIYFQPMHEPSGDIKEIAPRRFRWLRLIWIVPLIVPFFLAGLLYSWLLLKITEWLLPKITKRLCTQRFQLGISTLGIHLCNGQNLILWDEIKEVRPLKVLKIRFLWLIKESSEKTIMPWSGLERHSDLKAAVENCAPANHPIRKHLSLLKPEPPKKTS